MRGLWFAPRCLTELEASHGRQATVYRLCHARGAVGAMSSSKSCFESNSSTNLSANAFRSLASISGVIDPALELMSKTRFREPRRGGPQFLQPHTGGVAWQRRLRLA